MEGIALGFRHSPWDLANVNEYKIMFDPYSDSVAKSKDLQGINCFREKRLLQ